VDQVNGFAHLAKTRMSAPTILLQDRMTPYISTACEHEEHTVAVLDLERLLLSPEIRQFDDT
jgi:chemotaxis signal transduction protein